MSFELQEGIYYASKPAIGKSFCVLSLGAGETSRIAEIGMGLGKIWETLKNLKKGIISDLKVDTKHRKTGNLSVLIGYGSNIFNISGVEKKRPISFVKEMNFKNPLPEGGGTILDDSNLKYSKKICHNPLLEDNIVLQFIADDEFYTSRAIVEVWRELHRLKENLGISPLRITG